MVLRSECRQSAEAATTEAFSLRTRTTARRALTTETGSYVVFSTSALGTRNLLQMMQHHTSAPVLKSGILDLTEGESLTTKYQRTGDSLNVVGYIREPSSAESGDSMFAQSERVRMWVARHGYHLVAMCQDSAGTRNQLDGFRALLGIAARGQADLAVIPSLAALSPDKVVQEMMLMRLRMHNLAVASTERADHEQLSEPAVDPARMLVRDILHRIEDYRELLADEPDLEPAVPIQIVESGPSDADVLIEFVEAPAAG